MENLVNTAKKVLTFKEYAQTYFKGIKEIIDGISLDDLQEVLEVIDQAYRRSKQIFIIGNGGSAATASHFACDLGKGTAVRGKARFRVISLTDNMALVTAIGNDLGFEHLFSEQLENLLDEDDVVILLTGSGNSENLLRAAQYANSKGAVTVGLIGFGGGKLKDIVQKSIIVSSSQYELVEPIHLILEHVISFYFRYRIAAE